jgi:hypothetical protein
VIRIGGLVSDSVLQLLVMFCIVWRELWKGARLALHSCLARDRTKVHLLRAGEVRRGSRMRGEQERGWKRGGEEMTSLWEARSLIKVS